jgi:phosphatidylglycerophosphatase A
MSDPNSRHFSLRNPIHFLALGFGSGLLRPGPGTWGTLVAVPLYLLFIEMNRFGLNGYLAVTSLAFIVGIFLCGKTAEDAGVHDHSAIVWDEIVGFFIALTALPFSWENLVLAFVLFRLFDIFKPWPIKTIDQQLKGGFGIMFDDVIAGALACIVLHLLQPLILGYL